MALVRNAIRFLANLSSHEYAPGFIGDKHAIEV
jgi:hypothetical protein